MPRILPSFCLLAALACLPGCLQRAEKVTLNPDGSGKSLIDLRFVDPHPSTGPVRFSETLNSILRSAQGVDAWNEVMFKVDPSGNTHFRGTAYFKDISAFRLGLGGQLQAGWSKGEDGSMTLMIRPYAGSRVLQRQADVPREAEVGKRMAESKQAWAQNLPAMEAIYANMAGSVTYVLPGVVDHATQFKFAPRQVELLVDGKQIIANMNRLMSDDDSLKKAVAQGRLVGLMPDADLACRLVFGKPGLPAATVTGDLKPQFDYAGEAGAARKAELDLYKKFGLPTEGPGTQPAEDMLDVPTPR